jgi:acetyl esterase/lipase
LLLGAIAAGAIGLSLWPPHRPGIAAFGAFLIGWPITEAPFHVALAMLATTAPLVAAGALAETRGLVGLALVLTGLLGLVHHVRLSTHTTAIVERALQAGLGRDYHDQIAPAVRAAYDPTTPWRSLAAIWPWRPAGVERRRDIEYARVGARPLRLDILRRTDLVGPAPVFVYVHGGAWILGHKRQQGHVTLHELAAAGWVCVAIDYRLAPRATFPDPLDDVRAAIAWVKRSIGAYGGDPGFVMLGGGSAGAHLAALAALTARPPVDGAPDLRVQGCVCYYGVYDFADRDRAFRHGMFRFLLERYIMKGRLAEAAARYDAASPIAQVQADAPPFMVVHGDRDSIAPVAGAARFVDAFRAVARAPLVWARLPGAQHMFEWFPSLRSVPAVHGVHRFCQVTYSRHLAATRRA